jgi:hypothetical protein
MQNLCFGPKCTISGYQSCEASIQVHWSQNDVWKCFGVFRKPSAGKRWKTRVLGPNAVFRGTKVVKHPFKSIGPKMMFGSISEHFANPRQVKDEILVFRARMHYFRVPKLWSIHSSPLDPKWCLWVFRMISLTFGTNKMQNFCSSLNALFWGTKVVKHPF